MTLSFEEFVLAASTADLSEEPAAREAADAVEYRMDLAENGFEGLAAYDGDLPLIVTDRVEWEGGESPDTADRIDRLARAVDEPAVAAVDVELAAVEECAPVIEAAEGTDVSVIVSVHDFEVTPPREEFEAKLETACTHGDIGKLAVTAHSRSDVLDLLAATHELSQAGETVATMAMGEAGRHSRAVAPLYGSRIGYAPVDPDEATAPGQYHLERLRSLVEALQDDE
ncbi:type I 3-dehydroquinate dehydratase [Halovenus sp. WSH3]|uniref:3-dehydroquinate dehydratase n=1 Tax=Halovenus carboxidivorans TaxID=2692199 RepID=A0A6B0T6F2_9EURY|nr:type I 3-dehydroquinate dehydratase [Halovenus carboxidivorans]MXR51153.1 type I 3-dehydroquinate dehydratase [Halovenus carboxidivorans]